MPAGCIDTAAEEAYVCTFEVVQVDSTRLLELEAVKCLVRLWVEQGKGEEGLQMLKAIYNWFTEGIDTPMLVEPRPCWRIWHLGVSFFC